MRPHCFAHSTISCNLLSSASVMSPICSPSGCRVAVTLNASGIVSNEGFIINSNLCLKVWATAPMPSQGLRTTSCMPSLSLPALMPGDTFFDSFCLPSCGSSWFALGVSGSPSSSSFGSGLSPRSTFFLVGFLLGRGKLRLSLCSSLCPSAGLKSRPCCGSVLLCAVASVGTHSHSSWLYLELAPLVHSPFAQSMQGVCALVFFPFVLPFPFGQAPVFPLPCLPFPFWYPFRISFLLTPFRAAILSAMLVAMDCLSFPFLPFYVSLPFDLPGKSNGRNITHDAKTTHQSREQSRWSREGCLFFTSPQLTHAHPAARNKQTHTCCEDCQAFHTMFEQTMAMKHCITRNQQTCDISNYQLNLDERLPLL